MNTPAWTSIRLPPETRAELEAIALAEERSLHQVILRLLRKALKDQKGATK